MDTFKLLLALGLVIAGSVAFYVYADYSLLLRVLALLGVAGIALAIVMQTARGRTAWGFVKDARMEVRKVVWPTRAETTQTTLIVVVMVVIVGIILWIMDSILLVTVRWLTGQGA